MADTTATVTNERPTFIEQHHEELARRQAERDKTAEIREDCLDPREAAKHEMAKPHFNYKVSCSYRKPDPKTRKLTTYEFEAEVVAQNDADAWAHFCDKTGVTHSPNQMKTREIKRGKKLETAEVMTMNS